MKKIFTLLVLGFISLGMMAEKQISGVVLDAQEQPVIGASVTVKGTSTGTITDYDGEFLLSVKDDATTLVVSFVGMKTQEVAIKERMIIVLHEATEMLQDVVVTGYGNVSKGSFAGSAQAVDAEVIEKKSPTEITKALAGEVAGVQVINSSGQPGTNATLVIRGVGSINGNATPLYVVDGVPYEGDISAIDPGDIASTNILKDATAAALYGARGANGVVVITTKKGNSGEEGKIDVDVKYGANMRLLPLYDVITSPEEYVTMSWMSLYNSFRLQNNFVDKMSNKKDAAAKASKALYGAAGLPLGYNLWDAKGEYLIQDGLLAYGYANPTFDPTIKRRPGYENLESWADEIFRVGQKMEATAKFSGGTEKVNYFTSIGYLKDEGYYQASDFNRITLRSNLDFKPKKWLKGNLNISYAYTDMNKPNQDGGGAMNNGFYYVNAIPAIYPVFLRDENGNTYTDPRTGLLAYDYGDELNRPFGFGINPAGALLLDKEKYVQHTVNVQGGLELKLHKDLKVKVEAGMYYNNNLGSQLTNKYYGDAAGIGRIAQQSYNTLAFTAKEMLEYSPTFDEHVLSVSLIHENFLYQQNYVYGYKAYLADGESLSLSNAIQTNTAAGNSERDAQESFLAMLQYTYDERYVLNASYRADGSSRYAPGHRWGHFGSVSAAWSFTNEPFMEPVSEWLKDGKLRLSWGMLGNQIGSLYAYTNMYYLSPVVGQVGAVESAVGNGSITWERANQTDLGLELSVGKYLDVELDYYYKLTDNLLFYRAVAPSLGYSSLPTNDAKMVNQGVEFTFKAHAVDTRNVKLDIRLNGAHYKNLMTQMPLDYVDENGKEIRQKMSGAMSVGHSMYDHYTYVYGGVDEQGNALYQGYYDSREAEKGAGFGELIGNNEYNYIPSVHQWILEQEEAGVENPEQYLRDTLTPDMGLAALQYVDKSYLPDLAGGIGFDLDVYGVTLSVACSYAIGGYGYDYTYMALMANDPVGGHNWHTDMRNAWTEHNTNTNIPRLSNGTGEYDGYANQTSTRFLTSNSFFSLNSIQVGYNFPKKLIEKIKLNRLHIYLSADNLAIATARKGYNPMTSFTGSSDTHAYSPLSTFIGGIKLSF